MRKMKDSGVEWIGEIPEEWKCLKQKYVLNMVNGRAFKDTEFEDEGKYKILRVGNLYSNSVWYTSSLELPDDKYCDKGDLLFSWSMSYGPVIWYGEKVIYHYHIWKVVLNDFIIKKFAYYYLCALTQAVKSEIHETTMGFVTMGVMNNSYIALPDLPEQHRIADFLDTQCTRIDSLVTTIQSEIDTLEQYKHSLITEAVTKGLDPKAEMKDSGIEWIGEVPKEWDIVRGKYLFDNKKSIVGSNANLYDRLSLTMRGIIKRSKDDVDGLQPKDFESYQVVNKDDLVLRLIDLQNISSSPRVGLSLYDGIISPAYIILKSQSLIFPKYAFFFYYSLSKSNVFNYIGNSGVRSNLSIKDLAELQLPVPPIIEQYDIVNFLDSKCEKIDAIIDKLKNKLNDLEAYKKSLIFEYVTGKKEVPVA